MRTNFFIVVLLCTTLGCKDSPDQEEKAPAAIIEVTTDARGFDIVNRPNGERILRVSSPWPGSQKEFRYLLLPENSDAVVNDEQFDGVIKTPIKRIVVTSTTHIAALEALGAENTLVGFPGTRYVSSPNTRKLIDNGAIEELGANELINTERLLALEPDLVIGFAIDNQNKAYKTIEDAGIPVVYNGDWTEATPLGKAEWIKFFAPFFNLEKRADRIYSEIKTAYEEARLLASQAEIPPTVLSGALYQDVWYLPGGNSWAAAFIRDANARYLWADTPGNGSLSLSLESVLDHGLEADFWISPSEFTSYKQLEEAERHYTKFKAFREREIYTFAATKGATGGLLYFELGPQRPDLILKDLISIFHPQLVPDYTPYFFKPLE